jgi:hypothetical protein
MRMLDAGARARATRETCAGAMASASAMTAAQIGMAEIKEIED